MEYSFRELVRMDVKNNLTEEELTVLESDPHLWKDELTLLLQEVEQQFAQRKKEMPAEQLAPEEFRRIRKEYQSWKAGAIAFKTKICDRLRDVKAMVKDSNVSQSAQEHQEKAGMKAVLLEILSEVKQIRALLESR